MLVLAHDTTRLPEIPSESMCFQWIRWTPSDNFPTLLKVLFTLPVSSYDQTSGDLSGLDCTSGFIAQLDFIALVAWDQATHYVQHSKFNIPKPQKRKHEI